MQNWNLCCSTIWLSMHLRFVLGFFSSIKDPQNIFHICLVPSEHSVWYRMLVHMSGKLFVCNWQKKKIICHSTKPSFRVEVKEHVVRINCSQSFVTSLEGFYFPGAWKTYIKQDTQMIRTARVQSINSFASRKIFILKQQCLLP